MASPNTPGGKTLATLDDDGHFEVGVNYVVSASALEDAHAWKEDFGSTKGRGYIEDGP